MVMTSETLKNYLQILGIDVGNDTSSVSIDDVNDAFKKLALVLHPDKAGQGSTAIYIYN